MIRHQLRADDVDVPTDNSPEAQEIMPGIQGASHWPSELCAVLFTHCLEGRSCVSDLTHP